MEYRRVSTNSSGGLSAQLIGEENYDAEGEETASITFFMDLSVLYDLKGTSLEEANSHLILLEVTGIFMRLHCFDFLKHRFFLIENDPSLRRSTLLDGRTIDFLFANNTKRSFPGTMRITIIFNSICNVDVLK